MANKDQKRGNREVRKPKQAKAKPAAAAPAFANSSSTPPKAGKKG